MHGSFVRFTSYEDALQMASGSCSPRKRAKSGGHNKTAWEKAAKAQVQDCANKAALDIDDLPPATALLSAPIRRTDSQPNLDLKSMEAAKRRSASKPRKGKRKREATEEAEEAIEPEDVEGLVNVNDLHDLDSLDVGDGVLAREKRGKVYWPAKVLEYYPSSKWGEEARYKVLYLDNKQDVIPRSYIAHQDSDDFVTCKVRIPSYLVLMAASQPWSHSFHLQLGRIESEVVDDTVDADDEHEPTDLRSRSPSPQVPLPTTDQFNELSIREQLAYVKPVLQAILRNEYVPMQEKVDRFLSNDKAFLANLVKNSANEGSMVPTQVNTLVAYLKWWCLRGEAEPQHRQADEGGDDGEDVVSIVGDAPESVATEPIPSVAPSSPALSDLTISPVVEPPPSSFIASTSTPATQVS